MKSERIFQADGKHVKCPRAGNRGLKEIIGAFVTNAFFSPLGINWIETLMEEILFLLSFHLGPALASTLGV